MGKRIEEAVVIGLAVFLIIFSISFLSAGASSPLPDQPMTTPLTYRQNVILTLSLCRAHYLPADPAEFSVCVRQGVAKFKWQASEAYSG